MILGENKIGKTNLLYALRLVLDPTLPDSARQLQRTDFWDGIADSLSADDSITVSVELTDFDDNDDLMAMLAEHIISPNPMVSRLTYQFRPKTTLTNPPKTDSDYEFIVFGGGRHDNQLGYELRSRLPLEILPALRDAERDLATWSNSPLKPLLDDAASRLNREHLHQVADELLATQTNVLNTPGVGTEMQSEHEADEREAPQPPLLNLQSRIVSRLINMVGQGQSLNTSLGFSPTDPDKLIRAVRLFIDNGLRSISDASLGSANLIYLTLKSINLDQLVESGLRDHTFLAIEEPEAHLHPHLQRLVYRNFLHKREHQDRDRDSKINDPRQTVILTTHSPHIASVTPLRSIVLLRKSRDQKHTVGYSTVDINLSTTEEADIERYLDVNRGELLFARSIILVEGVAEEYLIPTFGRLLGFDFDQLGITVCSVSGTNFAPYVKLLHSTGLNIPFAVLTDLDPRNGTAPLGHNRVVNLLKLMMDDSDYNALDQSQLLTIAPEFGVFLNNHTFEIDLFESGAHRNICKTLIELTSNTEAKKRALEWCKTPEELDKAQYLKDLEAIGKGRFAQRLSSRINAEECPEYIRRAIEYVN